MNPFRYLHGGWSPWLIALLALAAALLAIVAWLRHRERRGDWGTGLVGVRGQAGYSPADLRGSAANVPSSARATRDPHEWWLLGLAAPFVEQERLLHDRWSLVPAACDDAWRRHLLTVASRWGVVRARDWKSIVADLEEQLAASRPSDRGWVDIRPWLVARLAMNLRLGIAARHTSGRRARTPPAVPGTTPPRVRESSCMSQRTMRQCCR